MSSDSDRYPLATFDGKWIPADILKPDGIVLLTFTNAASTAQIAIPTATEIIRFWASEDVVLKFGAAAAIPANGVYYAASAILEKNKEYFLAPPAATFAAYGLTAGGNLHAQFIKKWAGLSLKPQNDRR